jgi:hypothetical protein
MHPQKSSGDRRTVLSMHLSGALGCGRSTGAPLLPVIAALSAEPARTLARDEARGPTQRERRWREAASSADKELSDWLASAADDAAQAAFAAPARHAVTGAGVLTQAGAGLDGFA